MEAGEEAARLVEAHGRKAQQIVIDQIVAAIRRGDDATVAARSDVLRAIERRSWNAASI